MRTLFAVIFSVLCLELSGQELPKFTNKHIILAPLRGEYEQMVYHKAALDKQKFSKEYLLGVNIYGKPITVDSLFIINANSAKKKAVVMPFKYDGKECVGYFPLNFKLTKGIKSYMYHWQSSLHDMTHDKRKFDKNSTYCKMIGEYATMQQDELIVKYYNADVIKQIEVSYKDSLVSIILSPQNEDYLYYRDLISIIRYQEKNIEFIFKGFVFASDTETHLYKEELVYPLCMILKGTRTGNEYHIPLRVEEEHRFGRSKDYLSLLQISDIMYLTSQCKANTMNRYAPAFLDEIKKKCQDSVYIDWFRPSSSSNSFGFYDFCRWKDKTDFRDFADDLEWFYGSDYVPCNFVGFELMPIYDSPAVRIKRDKFGTTYGYYAKFTSKSKRQSDERYLQDTLYIPVDSVFMALVHSPNDYAQISAQQERELQERIEFRRIAANANYNYCVERWGKRIADIIQQGNVEFGFTPKMVIEAKHLQTGQAYKCYRERTPLGYATVYDFHDGDKFYFINKKLIGVSWQGEPTKYRKRQ